MMIANGSQWNRDARLMHLELNEVSYVHTPRFRTRRLCINSSSKHSKDVNRLFDRSKFSNLCRLDSREGRSINLLLATFRDINKLNEVISSGKFLILLNERSKCSKLVRQPISGGRYLQEKIAGIKS